MANIATAPRLEAIGGITLHAAGAIVATTADTAVFVDKCSFMCETDWSACDVTSSDEFYLLTIEANTLAAPTTWNVIAQPLCLSVGAHNASAGDATGTGQMRIGVDNPYNNQIRTKIWIVGTTPSINFVTKIYPLKDLSVYG